MSTPSAAAPTVQYTEKLWPSAGTWIWPLLLALTAGVALAPIEVYWGVIAGIIALITMSVILVLNTPVIEVTQDTLRVGRANIERQYIGEVTGYRGEEAFKQRGQKLHGQTFMNFRGGIDAVVRMEITDPRDQTPYWLTSTRRPEELTKVLGGVMDEYRQAALETEQDQGQDIAEEQ